MFEAQEANRRIREEQELSRSHPVPAQRKVSSGFDNQDHVKSLSDSNSSYLRNLKNSSLQFDSQTKISTELSNSQAQTTRAFTPPKYQTSPTSPMHHTYEPDYEKQANQNRNFTSETSNEPEPSHLTNNTPDNHPRRANTSAEFRPTVPVKPLSNHHNTSQISTSSPSLSPNSPNTPNPAPTPVSPMASPILPQHRKQQQSAYSALFPNGGPAMTSLPRPAHDVNQAMTSLSRPARAVRPFSAVSTDRQDSRQDRMPAAGRAHGGSHGSGENSIR